VTRETLGCACRGSARRRFGFASLHVLKHILHSSGARFTCTKWLACWNHGRTMGNSGARGADWHSPELRRLEAVVFRLAADWFGCATGEIAQEEIDRLPAGTQAWFEEFATSPAGHRFHARKDELWLHLSLVATQTHARPGDVRQRRQMMPDRARDVGR